MTLSQLSSAVEALVYRFAPQLTLSLLDDPALLALAFC